MDKTDEPSGFNWHVRDALAHIHDPSHLQRSSLIRFLHAEAGPGAVTSGGAIRGAILDAVESLRPTSEVFPGSPASRSYLILRLRYVEGLDIVEVMDRLAVSRSGYFAALQQAIDAVVLILSERWGLAGHESASARRQQSSGPSDVERSPAERWSGMSERPVLTNLPVSLTSFVGREREMAEVRRLLGEARLLTLTGAGGCGKTRLATETARLLLDAYLDGVWLVQLAPILDPALVPSAVTSTLGVREAAAEPVVATLVRHLRGRRSLLILDNCEHLLDACARLAESLLGACPSLTILATSRQPLGILGEVVLRVPSLSAPPIGESRSDEDVLQAVLSHDASRLFLDRARSALPSFVPSLGNASGIGEICRRLDGIPLAVELAAARVRAFSPDQIASRLDHDFHLLTGGSHTALPRQQTLRATLDWSYDLLSNNERVLLRRLSVFAGGFTLEAAEGVCKGDGVEELDVANLVAELVDKSLVEAATSERDARYRLLETVRQYAWHRLEEANEAEQIQRKHAVWITTLVRRDPAEVFGPNEALWWRRVQPEQANVRAALHWCRDNDPPMGLQLASLAWHYWTVRGQDAERVRWISEMLEHAPERTATRAAIISRQALDAAFLADYERARALGEESLAYYLEVADSHAVCDELCLLGQLLLSQGDHGRAQGILETCEDLARRLSYLPTLQFCLIAQGTSAWLAGDYPRAEAVLAEALSLSRENGHTHDIALAMFTLGGLSCSEGNWPRARALLEGGLDVLHDFPDPNCRGTALTSLAYVDYLEADLARAEERLSVALRLLSGIGHRPPLSKTLCIVAMLASRRHESIRVAHIAGAAEATNACCRHILAPNERAELDACLAKARAALGEEAFTRAWAGGQAMSLAEVVEYALLGST